MLRPFLAAAGVAVALMFVVAVLLVGRGKDRATITALQTTVANRDLTIRTLRGQADKLATRNDADLAAVMKACGADGTSAYDRGVQVGQAICEAGR